MNIDKGRHEFFLMVFCGSDFATGQCGGRYIKTAYTLEGRYSRNGISALRSFLNDLQFQKVKGDFLNKTVLGKTFFRYPLKFGDVGIQPDRFA